MERINNYLKTFVQNHPDSKFYIAISGGRDSVVLAHALKQFECEITALHMNYNLRGQESNDDEAFVRSFCEVNCIPLEVRSIKLNEELKIGGNLQEIARNHRYNWFKEKTNLSENNIIAVAHHSDDQIETFFINLIRGSGIMGLSAMLEKNMQIVRPLIGFSRKDITNYAHLHQLEWREDSSNSQLKYTRNSLRHALIPELEKESSELKSSVLYLIEHFQATQKSFEEAAQPFVISILEKHFIPEVLLSVWTDNLLIEILRQLDLPSSLLKEWKKLSSTQKGKFIELNHPNFDRLIREESGFSLRLIQKQEAPHLITQQINSLPNEFSKEVIYLDTDKIEGDLQIREWKESDRISPIGINGSQLISKIITDAKIPNSQRESIYVVHDNESIHWVVGLKIGKKAIASKESKSIIACKLFS